MSGRVLQIGGVAAAAGVGYYLYKAGGDPKAAQKKAEADATKLSNQVQDTLPGKKDEIKKDAQAAQADAGAKLDKWTKEAKDGVSKTAKDAEQNLNKAVDKFDKGVSEGASKAKGGISSWLGGSEKK